MSWIKSNAGPKRFLVWLCVLAGFLLLDSLVSPYLGFSRHPTDESGFGRIIFLLVAGSLAIRAMSADHQPLSYFGLETRQKWKRSFLIAVALGAAVPVTIYSVALYFDAYILSTSGSYYRYLSAGFTAMAASLIAAYLQEIIYRGYAGTVLRDWLGAFGILIGALFYALTFHFELELWLAPVTAVKTAFAMFLAGLLLHLARIYHGNLVVPIGLTTGWLMIGIYLKKTALLLPRGPNKDFLAIIAPGGDIRNSVIFWMVLAIAVFAYLALLKFQAAMPAVSVSPVHRETRPSGKVSSLFKNLVQFNPVSNLCALASIDVWIKVLWQARFKVHPAYLPRLILILMISMFGTIVNLPERFLLPRFLRNKKIHDPVVILGVHRSGTTFLHDILALDPQFVAPRGYQVFNPFGFFVFGRISHLLVGALMPWRRPMDSMELSFETPNEDEFGIALSVPYSPLWGWTLPLQSQHFDRYIYPDQMTKSERAEWKHALSIFLKKVMLFKTGRPLLKSPYHTAKIELLTELYPDARFIHLHRHPLDVYRSSIILQEGLLPLFQLQFPKPGQKFTDRLLEQNYLHMEDAYEQQSKALSPDQITETRYSDFATETIVEVKRIYSEIGLEFTDEFRKNIENYLANRPPYRRNKHETLNEETKQEIQKKLRPLYDRWGYEID